MSNDIWERAFRRSVGRGDDSAYALFVADEAVKRSWPTLHWHLPAAPAYVAACGRYVSKDRITGQLPPAKAGGLYLTPPQK